MAPGDRWVASRTRRSVAVLAAAPVVLGQAAYSRAFEFEADQAAVRMLQANGSSPKVFGVLFERLQRAHAARTFTVEDYDHRKGRTLGAEDWRRLASGPALVMIHGTLVHTKLAFAELDDHTVADLHVGHR